MSHLPLVTIVVWPAENGLTTDEIEAVSRSGGFIIRDVDGALKIGGLWELPRYETLLEKILYYFGFRKIPRLYVAIRSSEGESWADGCRVEQVWVFQPNTAPSSETNLLLSAFPGD